ncbi:AAA family ATPase [Marinicrinis sediminis]|uniref:AAA family ATPase n=1 Tax=Marinicrinis sediminis TaxID=1652465 RepID=A0ABW5RF71_9BACL
MEQLLKQFELPAEIKEHLRQEHTSGPMHAIDSVYFRSDDPVLYVDAIVSLYLDKPLLLQGPTGAGKTRLAETLSSIYRKKMYAVNCSVDLDAEALLGYKTLREQNGKAVVDFVAGPVIRAMEEGQLLYIDEVNMAKAETLPVLNSVLDFRRSITHPFTGQEIQAAAGFKVIAAINQGYIGTIPLNEALKNRFVILDLPYLQGEQLKQMIREQSRLQDEKLIDRFVQLSADLIHQLELGQLSEEAGSVRALLDACDLASFIHPLRAVQRSIADKLDEERERWNVMNLAETWFGEG